MTQSTPLAEAALFSVVLDAAVDAILVIDTSGTMVQTNAACAQLFGYQAADLQGADVKLLMPEPYRSEHAGYVQHYLDTREPKIIGIGRQVDGQRSNGEIFPISLSVGETEFDGKKYFVGIIRDLTEMQTLLEALREREGELRQMMDSAVVPTGIILGRTRLSAANEALNRFLEQPDATGCCLLGLLSEPKQQTSMDESLNKLHRESGVTVLRSVAFSIALTPRTADVYLASYPSRSATEGDHGIVIQLVDRTAQLAAEEVARTTHDQLTYYQRISTLGAVIAGIAHEVNQPMGAIANYAEAGQILVHKESVPRQELERIFQRIASQTSRANNVIRRLRSLASGASSSKDPVAPGDILEEAVRLFRPQLKQRGVATTVDRGHRLPTILVDRVQMQQVLLNLLENAGDAMLEIENPTIALAATTAPEGLLLSVTDRGTGISPKIADRLTDPFFTSKPDGMGIGLAVCRTVVENHHGRLWFENNDDGPGTTFFILLPESKKTGND